VAGTAAVEALRAQRGLRGRGGFGDNGREDGGGDCGRGDSRARGIAGAAEQSKCGRLH
jgi:hypothetical protein